MDENVTENKQDNQTGAVEPEPSPIEEPAPGQAEPTSEKEEPASGQAEPAPESKKHHGKLWITLAVILIILALIYIGGARYFSSHFMFHTTVNGEDVSLMTQSAFDDSIAQRGSDYKLTITGRDSASNEIDGTDIDYKAAATDEEKRLVASQNEWTWPLTLFSGNSISTDGNFTYDADKLDQVISALPMMQADNMTAPKDASIEITDDGYTVQKEEEGTTLKTDQVKSEIEKAVSDGTTQLALTDDDYEAPSVTADSSQITDITNQLDKYENAVVTYDIEGADEKLDKGQILKMLDIDTEKGTVSINDEAVTNYVQNLATKYNTYGSERQFTTHDGSTVTIGGGDYGYVVSKSGEKEELIKDLESGQPTEREPVYEQKGLMRSTDGNDIGDTYLEIDYTNQHIYYYKDGTLQMDSDIVSGNTSVGNGSPDGIFTIKYKKSPATLVGEDYSSDVTYFIVFSYNVGVHDASWRSSFGGTIYQSSGSHGCINVPLSFAANLYNAIEDGTPVVAYYRNAVTLTSENARHANAYSYSG